MWHNQSGIVSQDGMGGELLSRPARHRSIQAPEAHIAEENGLNSAKVKMQGAHDYRLKACYPTLEFSARAGARWQISSLLLLSIRTWTEVILLCMENAGQTKGQRTKECVGHGRRKQVRR